LTKLKLDDKNDIIADLFRLMNKQQGEELCDALLRMEECNFFSTLMVRHFHGHKKTFAAN